MPPKYYGTEPRRRGGGSSGNYTTRSGGQSYLLSAPNLVYTVPSSVTGPVEPSMHTTPQIGGAAPRPLGLSSAATNPGRQPSPSPPSSRSSSSPSPSVHSRPGSRSAGASGSPAGNPSSQQQGSHSGLFGGAGLPPPPPAGLKEDIHRQAKAREAETRRQVQGKSTLPQGTLPPPPPPGYNPPGSSGKGKKKTG